MNPRHRHLVAVVVDSAIDYGERDDRSDPQSSKSEGAAKTGGVRRGLARDIDVGTTDGAKIAQGEGVRQPKGSFCRAGKVVANPCAAARHDGVQADAHKDHGEETDTNMLADFGSQRKQDGESDNYTCLFSGQREKEGLGLIAC